MKSETKDLLIDVGTVALGGVVNMVAEYATSKYVSSASYPVGGVTFYAADGVGVGSAVVEVVAGKMLKKRKLVLFGAGGLAASLAVIVGKALIAIPTSTVSFAPMSVNYSARFDIAPAKKGSYR